MLWQEGFFICPPSEIFYFSTDNLLNRNLADLGQISVPPWRQESWNE
jgi:hypothetical protein